MAKVLRTGENGADFSHALCPASNTGTPGALVSFWLKFLPFLVLHTLEHTAWTHRAAGPQMPGRVFTMNNTPHLRHCDHAFLALVQDTGFCRTLPRERAVIGIPFIGATFAPLTTGSPLLDSQGAVSGQRRALLSPAGHFLVQADTHYTRVVRDKWNLEDFTFIFTFCNRTLLVLM